MTGDAYVVDERDLPAEQDEGDTASTRVTIDASAGCPRLEQRVIRFEPGRSRARVHPGAHAVLYVVSGRGELLLEGERHALEPEMGVYAAPGERYEVDNPGPEELVAVAVVADAESVDGRRRGVTVRYADQPALPAGKDREFRYLVNQEVGCPDVTQFVGSIPPGRSPMHSHSYDEVIYVLDGEGVLHTEGRATTIAAGSCIHLPPLLMHCLENRGDRPMRVLGVFHPAGDPASRAAEAPE